MRGAVVAEVGRPPEVREVGEPEPGEGEALIDVLAAPLNPLDISVGSGRFYGGHPDPPYVPGSEAVGRVRASERFEVGTLAWAHGGGFGQRRDGGLAERAVVPDSALTPLPDCDAVLAGALGVAGLAG
ncbi:MAG: zinc-binding alcohol dehydrogenase family protein, partial [Actinomycetota bacterium]|nr:zinc-binding alcohol dehydrogenase family protein [Actinomycetota bacterium]